jgi:predicted nucleic acid-binding protein
VSVAVGFLLDTNAISETIKLRPNANVLSLLNSVPNSSLYLSVLTIGELRKGDVAKRRRHPSMTDRYGSWIDALEGTYADRILPVDKAIATLWGELNADRSRAAVDTLLAATAIVHGLTLVTRNVRDVDDLPVKLLNPWLP